MSGCERTVPTLPLKAEVSRDTNWKELGVGIKKKTMRHEPELRGDGV